MSDWPPSGGSLEHPDSAPPHDLLYATREGRVTGLKPGITGWAQIHGRNRLSWEEKFEYDIWCVDHQSFWLDVCILAKTVWQVLRRDGISQPGHVTMPEFLGGAPKR